MEHIVQFGINIDDASIAEAIKENVQKEVIKQIKKDMAQLLFLSSWGSPEPRNGPTDVTVEIIETFLSENRDDILEMTSKKLAEKLVRTSAAKALLTTEVLKNAQN